MAISIGNISFGPKGDGTPAKKKTAQPAASSSAKATPSTSFVGAPPTIFPQYTSGPWANLPTGMLGSMPPSPATPAPATPAPATPASGGQSSGLLGGLLGGRQISQFPQHYQDLMNQRWSMIGGGQPMPARFGDYMGAKNAWTRANPGQQLPGRSPLDGPLGRLFGYGLGR